METTPEQCEKIKDSFLVQRGNVIKNRPGRSGLLLVLMALLAGGAARHESVTIDEVAHIGAGVSYLQSWTCG